ncbi:SpoIIE family protein phosphatase [Acidobacteria bacterium AH-259-O06]|nr:SpoIIE family protein phosphatase [Acidobacteria bacterium AH-259-O06]
MAKRIGEILRAKGYVSETQLNEALQIQSQSQKHKLLGQILIDQGLITQEQAQLFNYCQKCLMLDLVGRINSTTELQSLLSAIMEAARDIMEAEGSSLIVLDHDKGDLIIAVPTGPASNEISGTRIPSGKGFCGWVVRHGEPVVVSDVYKDSRFYLDIDKATGFRTRNLICVPLHTPQGEIMGAIEAVNRRDGKDFSDADVPLFSVFADQAAIALERARLQKESLEKQLLEQELSLAYQIQEGFWPKEFPSYPGIGVAAMSLPATHVGGDYYDFVPIQDDSFAVVIGDVSGKGMPAALLMATLRAMLRTQVENNHPVEETIFLVNNTLVKETPSNKFVTLFYGVLDVAKRELTYVNAGHNPPLLYDHNTGEIKELADAGGLIIGFIDNLKFEAARQRLRPGQLLVFFTDGVTEAQNPCEEFFGQERLRAVIREQADKDAQTLMERIYQAVKDFTQNHPQSDDLTMIVLKIEGTRRSDREATKDDER